MQNGRLSGRGRYYEIPACDIAEILRGWGYEIADTTGMRMSEPYHDAIGILKPRETAQKGGNRQRASHIGNLFLDDRVRKAIYHIRWVLAVYGKENVSELTALAEEISRSWGVHVQVRLESENPRLETYLSDYDP